MRINKTIDAFNKINSKISNGSKKRCREKFQYKGIGKLINSACWIINLEGVDTVISEFIYDYDDPQLYNVMLFLLKENFDIDELNKFDYIDE